LGLIIIAVVAASLGGYFYVYPALFPPQKTTLPMTVIHIPKGSSIPPTDWHNFTDLSSPTFHYPVNMTVTIGMNNTIEWINDDPIAHTVYFFQFPPGASNLPQSGLILQGKTFTVTLIVPGVYKYFCAWHNWLAGQITVKLA